MLKELNNIQKEAKGVNFPIDGNDMEKAGAVLKLLIAMGMLIKVFTGKKADAAIDQIIAWIKGISTGALIIQKATDKS